MTVSNPLSKSGRRPGPGVGYALELAALGLALVLSAVVMMAIVASAIYGSGPADDAEAFRLGLAGTSLLSALSQICLLTGGWLVWRSTRGQGK